MTFTTLEQGTMIPSIQNMHCCKPYSNNDWTWTYIVSFLLKVNKSADSQNGLRNSLSRWLNFPCNEYDIVWPLEVEMNWLFIFKFLATLNSIYVCWFWQWHLLVIRKHLIGKLFGKRGKDMNLSQKLHFSKFLYKNIFVDHLESSTTLFMPP